ncbi:MAG TPA: DNA primase [Victivallales bacterium]|nr:DNA primase [Victivallales bacterium]HPO89750.1 DNA primase [Victivallales bacterium]HRU02306.1 DNA primase [Victivallales bacterium]
MPFIPDNIIEDIKAKSDIIDVIQTYFPLKRAGTSFKALCPFHNEKTPSFTVSPSRQMYYCFGCGKGGDVVKFIMEKENVDYITAIKILADRAGINIPEKSYLKAQSHTKDQKERLFKLHQDVLSLYHKNLVERKNLKVFEYAKKRGITDEIIEKFELGASSDSWDEALKFLSMKEYSQNEMLEAGIILRNHENGKIYDRFRNRLIFPIKDEIGRTVGFSARSIDNNEKEAKYVNSPETPIFKKGKLLYALHLAKESIRKKDFSIICEGQLDVIAMHCAGITNAVAPQGTSFTNEQAALLKRYSNKVYICFDGDEAGKKAIFRAIEILLSLDMETYVIVLPPDDDPDSILKNEGPEKLKEIIDSRLFFFDFLMNEVFPKDKTLSPFEKKEASLNVTELIAKINNPVLRNSFISTLAIKMNTPESLILDELRKKQNHSTQKEQNNNPLSSSLESQMRKAEEILLELCLFHGTFCRKLAEDLPEDMISSTPVGRAIETAVSMTLNGEWERVVPVLSEKLNESNDPILGKILVSESNFNEESAKKAYEDCIMVIKNFHISREISTLMHKITLEKDEDEKIKLSQKVFELKKQKNLINKTMKKEV